MSTSFPQRTRSLALLALLGTGALVMPTASHAGPRVGPVKKGPIVTKAKRMILPNGVVQVDPVGKEFPQVTTVLSYHDTPANLYVNWSKNHKPAAWARWEIYKKANNTKGRVTIASGLLKNPPGTKNANTNFTIQPQKHLPLHNTKGTAQEYYVSVFSKASIDDKQAVEAKAAKLIHLPKGTQPKQPVANPYNCSTQRDQYAKNVQISIPQMTVNQTSGTAGDGDRDELYITVGRLGPGTASSQVRLPGADDYFEAHQSATVGEGGWTNQKEKHVSHPVAWTGSLKHGEKVTLWITAAEQDNADLKSMKHGVIAAMNGIATVAQAVGGGYGEIVAAAAQTIAAGNQFVPDTDKHDFIGFAGVQIANQCGHIQTTWVTYPDTSHPDGYKVSNSFIDVSTHQGIESRLAVLFAPKASDLQFYPFGVDYGPFVYAGDRDEFFWALRGTNKARYTFLLRTRTWN